MDFYLATEREAKASVAEIVKRYAEGDFEKEVGFDLETSPIKPLVGYPGTRWVILEDGTEEIAPPDKDEYLAYAQKVWRGHFNPWLLSNLGLYIPVKRTTGKESDGKAAGEAWNLFHSRLQQLSDAQIENSKWNKLSAEVYISNKRKEIADLEVLFRFCTAFYEDEDLPKDAGITAFQQFPALKNYTKTQKLTKKGAESALKKLYKEINELTEATDTLEEDIAFYLENPIDIRLLRHVVNVPVEKRIKQANGRNVLDPIKPGLDPYTSEIFLSQFTFYGKEGNDLNYIFNHHRYDYSLIEPLLSLAGATYLGANIKFDLGMSMVKLGDPYKVPIDVFCTQVASRLLYLGIQDMKHGLEAVAKRFLRLDISKEVRSTFIGRWYLDPTPDQLEYASTDTRILRPIYLRQMHFAKKNGQEQLLKTFSELSWPIANMETRGYCIDEEKWLSIAADEQTKKDAFATELRKMLLPDGYIEETTGEEDENDDIPILNMSQKAKVAELLPELLKMDLKPLFKDGKVSVKKDNLEMIEREYVKIYGQTHEFFMLWKKYSKAEKCVSTYGKRFLWYRHPLTGRFHPGFIIAGTDTSRLKGVAPNFLQIPSGKEEGDADFRSAFIADEGYYIVGADYNSAEWVIAANWSQDPMLGRLFSTPGVDPHRYVGVLTIYTEKGKVEEIQEKQDVWHYGSSVLPIKKYILPENWTDEQRADFALRPDIQGEVGSLQRKASKSTGFTYLFVGSAYGMAQKTGLPKEQCQELLDSFANLYNKLDAKMKETAEAVFTRWIELGGKRYAWVPGFGGIRRYSELPENPNPDDFPTWNDYKEAAREYKRSIGAVQREQCNLPMQGTNAVVTAEALVLMSKRGRDLKITPWLSIYDENLILVPKTVDVDTAAQFLEDGMVGPGLKYFEFCRLGAEVDRDKIKKTGGKYWIKS